MSSTSIRATATDAVSAPPALMGSVVTRIALVVSSLLLVTASSASGEGTPEPVPQEPPLVEPWGTYDGWAVSVHPDVPPACPGSPDQVDRMLGSDRPLPGCVRRLQRWFQQEYDPSWSPARRADR